MIPRLPHARSGITLTEILISILIMGVGMISLAVLFPIGLLRLQSAQRLSRSTYLAESAMNDLQTRNLLSQTYFANWVYSPWYNLTTYTPSVYNPWIQDTPQYQGNPYGTPAGVSRTLGPGLPVAYDPLWRYQTNGGYYPDPIGTVAHFEARFASGYGFVRADPDGGNPSADGLQRVSNFNPTLPFYGAVPDTFVSPEDIVLMGDESQANSSVNNSPIVPDMSGGMVTNDWRYSWFFTGQQSDANNSTVFDGDIVVCENRQFNIEGVASVQGYASGPVPLVTGETVVEGIFGFSRSVSSLPAGYGLSATKTVLLRWPSTMDDPEVKVGSWVADVTYERVATLDFSRLNDTITAISPGYSFVSGVAPYQRCYWYQIAKKSPADVDELGVAGYRSMTVWTVAPLRAQTLITAAGAPVHVNSALLMPTVVNVISRTFYTR